MHERDAAAAKYFASISKIARVQGCSHLEREDKKKEKERTYKTMGVRAGGAAYS